MAAPQVPCPQPQPRRVLGPPASPASPGSCQKGQPSGPSELLNQHLGVGFPAPHKPPGFPVPGVLRTTVLGEVRPEPQTLSCGGMPFAEAGQFKEVLAKGETAEPEPAPSPLPFSIFSPCSLPKGVKEHSHPTGKGSLMHAWPGQGQGVGAPSNQFPQPRETGLRASGCPRRRGRENARLCRLHPQRVASQRARGSQQPPRRQTTLPGPDCRGARNGNGVGSQPWSRQQPSS